MSFTDAYDMRSTERFFDVHYWPHIARIVTINQEPANGAGPIVADITLNYVSAGSIGDACYVMAAALCDAAQGGTIVRHNANGSAYVEQRQA